MRHIVIARDKHVPVRPAQVRPGDVPAEALEVRRTCAAPLPAEAAVLHRPLAASPARCSFDGVGSAWPYWHHPIIAALALRRKIALRQCATHEPIPGIDVLLIAVVRRMFSLPVPPDVFSIEEFPPGAPLGVIVAFAQRPCPRVVAATARVAARGERGWDPWHGPCVRWRPTGRFARYVFRQQGLLAKFAGPHGWRFMSAPLATFVARWQGGRFTNTALAEALVPAATRAGHCSAANQNQQMPGALKLAEMVAERMQS